MKQRSIHSCFRQSALALTLAALTSLPLRAADPAAVLPDESVAYAEMDIQEIYKLAGHPVVKTLPLKDLEKLMLKFTGSTVEEQEALKKELIEATGVSYEELEKKSGRFAASVHDLKIPANPTPENVGVEISIAHEFDGDEAFMEKYVKAIVKIMGKQMKKQGGGNVPELDQILEKAKDFLEEEVVEHAGAKIHVWKLKEKEETKEVPVCLREWAYAITDKMIVLSSGQDQVEEMIDRIKSGGQTGSLAGSAYYKNDHDKAGKTLGLASLNLETILGLVEKYALPMAANSDVDVNKIWKSLGADKLRSGVLALSAGTDAIDVAALVTYSEKPGLFAAVAIPGPGTAPAFLPKGLASAGYQQIDIAKTLENIEKLANDIDVRAGAAINMGLEMAKAQVGVDIRKDIIGQLGPDIWIASAPIEKKDKPADDKLDSRASLMMSMMGGKSLLGVRVKDSKVFGSAVDTIINKVAQKDAVFESREYQGFTIFTVKESPEEFRIGYVLTDDWLIVSIGAGEVLEKVLPRLGKTGDDGFFAQKHITRHLDAMRGGQAATSVTDVGEMLEMVLTMFEEGFKEGFRAGGAGPTPEIPFGELAKLLNVPLLSIDKAWLENTHAEYRMRIVPKE